MTRFLPPHLMAMFAPREAPKYLPPLDLKSAPKRKRKRKQNPLTGVADYLSEFEDPSQVDQSTLVYIEKKQEKRDRLRALKENDVKEELKQEVAKWKPKENPDVTGDAFKTIIIARLAHETTEDDLRDHFGDFGKIVSCKIVRDKEGKSRGYAFVEYDDEKSMRRAYTDGDARKIHGRRVLVDVERGRTVPTWLPRRLGGGAGFTRKGKPSENQTWAGREPPRPREYGAPMGRYGAPPMDRYGGPPRGGRGGPRGYIDRDGSNKPAMPAPPLELLNRGAAPPAPSPPLPPPDQCVRSDDEATTSTNAPAFKSPRDAPPADAPLDDDEITRLQQQVREMRLAKQKLLEQARLSVSLSSPRDTPLSPASTSTSSVAEHTASPPPPATAPSTPPAPAMALGSKARTASVGSPGKTLTWDDSATDESTHKTSRRHRRRPDSTDLEMDTTIAIDEISRKDSRGTHSSTTPRSRATTPRRHTSMIHASPSRAAAAKRLSTALSDDGDEETSLSVTPGDVGSPPRRALRSKSEAVLSFRADEDSPSTRRRRRKPSQTHLSSSPAPAGGVTLLNVSHRKSRANSVSRRHRHRTPQQEADDQLEATLLAELELAKKNSSLNNNNNNNGSAASPSSKRNLRLSGQGRNSPVGSPSSLSKSSRGGLDYDPRRTSEPTAPSTPPARAKTPLSKSLRVNLARPTGSAPQSPMASPVPSRTARVPARGSGGSPSKLSSLLAQSALAAGQVPPDSSKPSRVGQLLRDSEVPVDTLAHHLGLVRAGYEDTTLSALLTQLDALPMPLMSQVCVSVALDQLASLNLLMVPLWDSTKFQMVLSPRHIINHLIDVQRRSDVTYADFGFATMAHVQRRATRDTSIKQPPRADVTHSAAKLVRALGSGSLAVAVSDDADANDAGDTRGTGGATAASVANAAAAGGGVASVVKALVSRAELFKHFVAHALPRLGTLLDQWPIVDAPVFDARNVAVVARHTPVIEVLRTLQQRQLLVVGVVDDDGGLIGQIGVDFVLSITPDNFDRLSLPLEAFVTGHRVNFKHAGGKPLVKRLRAAKYDSLADLLSPPRVAASASLGRVIEVLAKPSNRLGVCWITSPKSDQGLARAIACVHTTEVLQLLIGGVRAQELLRLGSLKPLAVAVGQRADVALSRFGGAEAARRRLASFQSLDEVSHRTKPTKRSASDLPGGALYFHRTASRAAMDSGSVDDDAADDDVFGVMPCLVGDVLDSDDETDVSHNSRHASGQSNASGGSGKKRGVSIGSEDHGSNVDSDVSPDDAFHSAAFIYDRSLERDALRMSPQRTGAAHTSSSGLRSSMLRSSFDTSADISVSPVGSPLSESATRHNSGDLTASAVVRANGSGGVMVDFEPDQRVLLVDDDHAWHSDASQSDDDSDDDSGDLPGGLLTDVAAPGTALSSFSILELLRVEQPSGAVPHVIAVPLAELLRRQLTNGELLSAPSMSVVYENLEYFGSCVIEAKSRSSARAAARNAATTYAGSELCRRSSAAVLWSTVKLFLRTTRVPLVPAGHLTYWLDAARTPPSRTRLFQLHCLLLALPPAHQVTMSLLLSSLHDLALGGTASFAALAAELAQLLTRSHSASKRFASSLRLLSVCEELIVNQSTLGLGLIDAATLHQLIPATVFIDLASSKQRAIKSGVLSVGSKSFGSIKWQNRFCSIIGTFLVVYDKQGDTEPIFAIPLDGKKPATISTSMKSDSKAHFSVKLDGKTRFFRTPDDDTSAAAVWVDLLRRSAGQKV